MLGITIIAQWIAIICLIIRIGMVEKEVENIKSWEPFVTIYNSKIGELNDRSKFS